MIDLHSHILPGVDDGAQDMAVALEMLRLAVADGVTTQVLTPHIHPHRYNNTPASLKQSFTEFKAVVEQQQISVQLLLAAEIRIEPEIMQQVKAADMPWLGGWEGSKVFLLEFPYSQLPVGSLNVIEWLRKQNIIPMIAHPERTAEIQQNPEKLLPFIEAGCLLQITASSLTGHFGRTAYELAAALLKAGQVTAIASDCHNLDYRPPALKAGIDVAAQLIGEQAALELVTTNPQRLLQGLEALDH